jgi:hypothetical protein
MGQSGIGRRAIVLAIVLCGAVASAASGAGSGSASPPYPWGDAVRFERLRLAVDDGAIPTVGLLSGVSIDPTWALGVGVEYDRYDGANVVPLFLHLRVTPRGGEVGHLVFVEGGYSLFWLDGTPGTDGSGPFVRGGMGRRVARLFGSEVHVSVSYRVQASEAYADRTGRETSALTQFALSVEFGL